MATIEDRRAEKTGVMYVIFTDSFMSGWGQAPRRSLYVLACSNSDEAYVVLDNGKRRPEMKRGRVVRTLPRFRADDHVSIVDKAWAPRWYRVGAWAVGDE